MKLRYQSKHFAFHATLPENSILIQCPITGIASAITFPTLPIILEHTNPLANPKNALMIIKECQKTKQWELDSQTIAGLILSLLAQKERLGKYPNSSAVEANMMLQQAGKNALRLLALTIAERWDSDLTWQRMPRLSFDLATYQYPITNFTGVISQYTRLIAKALIIEDLGSKEAAQIWTAWRENAKAAKGIKTISRIDATISRSKLDTFQRQWDYAKVLYHNLAEGMPLSIKAEIKSTVQNLNIYFSAHKKRAASLLREWALENTDQQILTLADTIEHAHDPDMDDDALGFSAQHSPIIKSERKTVAEILAEKLAQAREGKNNV